MRTLAILAACAALAGCQTAMQAAAAYCERVPELGKVVVRNAVTGGVKIIPCPESNR